MFFNQEEFDAKLKKAMDAINELSNKMTSVAENVKEVEETVKKEPKESVKETIKENINKTATTNDFDYTTANQKKFVDALLNSNKMKPSAAKQEFGIAYTTAAGYTPVGGHSYNSYNAYGYSEDYNDFVLGELVESIKVIYSAYFDVTPSFMKSTGNPGECYVFNNNKAYVWSGQSNSWVWVPFKSVQTYWNQVQADYYNKQSYNTWDNGYTYYSNSGPSVQFKNISYSQVPKPEEDAWATISKKSHIVDGIISADKISAGKIKFTPLDGTEISVPISEKVTKTVVQKTKPSKPKNGTLWIQSVTGACQIYLNNSWKTFTEEDKKQFDAYKKSIGDPVVTIQKNVSQKTGMHFRGNCGKWHEIINPEITVFKSLNGEYTWFFSSNPPAKEYGCGHDNMRAMPAFTTEEKNEKVKEITEKQQGSFETTYYINVGGVKQKWEEIHSKQTITIGTRPFHHRSNVKVWYICLTYDELIAVKNKNIPEQVKKDLGNIFIDALPYSESGYCWFLDGTHETKSSKTSSAKIEEALYLVQLKADEIMYGSSAKAKKNKDKELGEPKKYDDYRLDTGEITSYLMPFDNIYDNMYSIDQYKNKAMMLHRYLMFDLKLAALKKDKKEYNARIEAMETLQEKFNEAEMYYVQQNTSSGLYLKKLSKVQAMYSYFFDNKYGIE